MHPSLSILIAVILIVVLAFLSSSLRKRVRHTHPSWREYSWKEYRLGNAIVNAISLECPTLKTCGPWKDIGSWHPNTWTDVRSYVRYWEECSKRVPALCESLDNLPVDRGKLEQRGYGLPVVHLRCSDVPFIRDYEYELPTSAAVRDAAKIIVKAGYTRSLFIMCSSHHKHPCEDDPCARWSRHYRSVMREEGVETTPTCNNPFEDFALMRGAPLLVVLVNSSFAMMAKVDALERLKMIYTLRYPTWGHPTGAWESSRADVVDQIPWALRGDTIDHATVEDYCDFDFSA